MFFEYQGFLQNNLMELHGIIKVIDEHFFGDDQSL